MSRGLCDGVDEETPCGGGERFGRANRGKWHVLADRDLCEGCRRVFQSRMMRGEFNRKPDPVTPTAPAEDDWPTRRTTPTDEDY